MVKLKLQYFVHLMQRSNSLKNTLLLGKTEGGRRELRRTRRLDGITDSMDMSLGKLWEERQGNPVGCSPRGRRESDMPEGSTLLLSFTL